jgi:flagellar biosynthesis GTPase FlhF
VLINARILPAYLDARLAELKWGAAVQELNRQWQDEQRSRREELRAAQRDAEEIMRKQQEAARDTELKRQAVAEAEKQFANASAEMKAQYEEKLEEARQKLVEATTRELTAAQLGKMGCIYIISNMGSFNYEGTEPTIFKIGMTRRPNRQERIDELSNASVPFAFNVHALIKSENAPSLACPGDSAVACPLARSVTTLSPARLAAL